jgi:hypothetical protein
MKKLLKSIEPLIQEELERANEKFPQFASAHEGYAVIKEEYEEAQAELNLIGSRLWNVWDGVKNNEKFEISGDADELKDAAICLAAEAIQTAAMAQKFIDMLEREVQNGQPT